MQINLWTNVVALLLLSNVLLVESKRTLSIGRSRKKPSANINVRRKGPDQPKAPVVHESHPPAGPPPPYPGVGGRNTGGSSFDAPPAYSASRSNPPSYAEAMKSSQYPRQTYSGSNIGQIPQRGSTMNTANYPNQGLYTAQHQSFMPVGGGIGGMGGMANQPYGSGYGYGSSSPFSFGNVLAGLALWNVARSFGSHGRTQHIYVEKEHSPTAASVPPPIPAALDLPHYAEGPHVPSNEGGFMVDASTGRPHEDQPPTLPDNNGSVEYTTDHPSLWIYAMNTVPIRTEVVVADKASYN